MEPFRWGDEFETHIPQVDSQHRSLVKMINEFGGCIAENTVDEDFLLTLLRDLAEYAQIHFQTEEKLMSAVKLDGRHVRGHVQQHNDFVGEVSALAEAMETANEEDFRSLFAYLTHWLAYHILGSDINMARQIEAVRKGGDAAAAYERLERQASDSTGPLLAALQGLFQLVSQRNRALSDLNATLEKRVAERTAELLEANEQLKKLSITDHLTGLPNRRFAMVQLDLLWEEAARNKTPLSCLMIDADGFKEVNDSYGHDAGDAVLRRLAKELLHSVRSDDLVCRMGGDEFVVLCPNTGIDGALILAEENRRKVAELRVAAGEGFWPGSVSIGAACTDKEMESINDLLKAADKAVYRAKKDGRNCVRS